MASATFYLALSESKRHPYLAARISARRPTLKPGEIALALDVSVPDALFKRPILHAKVTVPPGSTVPEVSTEVANGIAEAVRSQLGVRLQVSFDQEGDHG